MDSGRLEQDYRPATIHHPLVIQEGGNIVTIETVEQQRRMERWSLGAFGLLLLSFTAICALIALIVLVISTSLNLYLGSRLLPYRPELVLSDTSLLANVLPEVINEAAAAAEPVSSAEVAQTTDSAPLQPLPIDEPIVEAVEIHLVSPAPQDVAPIEPSKMETEQIQGVQIQEQTSQIQTEAAISSAPKISTNQYEIIPLEPGKGRDARPAGQHADLKLKLREPKPLDQSPSLIDLSGATDPTAPNLGAIFEPDFVKVYGIHDWNWDAGRKGALLDKSKSILVEVKTNPGDAVFIPPRPRHLDIYQDKIYAVLLYASEDSVTFVYARQGTVVGVYAIHYQGLQVDPNLLNAYRSSEGNNLPGLDFDTPVGTAKDSLLVAIRDKGTFMNILSRKDWWK